MALTPSFCRGAARLVPIDGRTIGRTILCSSFFITSHPTRNQDKNGHEYFRRPPQYWPAAFAAFAATRAAYDACDDRDVRRARCMDPSQESGAKGGRRSRHSRGEIVLDPDDPNDRAFDLIANYDVPIEKAKKATNASVSYQALHQRLRRHKINLRREDEATQEAAECLASFRTSATRGGRDRGSTSTVTPRSATAKKGRGKQRSSPPPDLGLVTCPSSPVRRSPRLLYDRRAAAMEASIHTMPAWVDKKQVKKSVSVKKRRSSALANDKYFHDQAKQKLIDARYSSAVKLATVEYQANKDQGNTGKGTGLRPISEKYNVTMLNLPDDREIKPTTLRDYIKEGIIGVSPPKRGRRRAIPNPVTDQLARETAMMQASGEGEATTAKLCRVLDAATTGTEHAGKFNSKYVVKRAKRYHPHIFQPRKAISDDDRQVEWMTVSNVDK